jgi:hypothetical protein
MTYKALHPKYVLLEPRSRTRDYYSTDSGFEMEAGVYIDQSLINHLARYGVVKQNNPAPDVYGNTCMLMPGDRVISDFNLYNNTWQDGTYHDDKGIGTAQIANKQNIIAFERDGKMYGNTILEIKEVDVENTHKLNSVNPDPRYTPTVSYIHKYKKGYHFCIRREDLYDKLFRSKYSSLALLEENRDEVRNTYTCFEIISEEKKGDIVLYNFDWAIPVEINIRDYNYDNDPDFKTCLRNQTYYGIESNEIICQITL